MSSSSSMPYISEPVELVNFVLPLNLKQYITIFWDNSDYQTIFLTQRILEKNVKFSPWSIVPGRKLSYERIVRCTHPLPFSLPWLPVEVKVKTTQRMTQGENKNIIHISEYSRVKGIPYTEPYIVIDWTITAVRDKEVKCQLSLHFEYEKVTFLKVQIESNAFVELTKFFKSYKNDISKKIVSIKHTNKQLLTSTAAVIGFFNDSDNNLADNERVMATQIVLGYYNPLISLNPTLLRVNETDDESNRVPLSRESIRMTLSLSNEDYIHVFDLLSNFSKEDLDDMIEIINSKSSISYEDMFATELTDRYSFVIFSLISFFVTIKSLELAKWCQESFRVWSFIRMHVFLIFFYVICLIALEYAKVYLRRKRDKSLVFDIQNIS